MKLSLRKLIFGIITSSGIILLIESALRIGGFPHGYFAGFFFPEKGQYPKNSEIHMNWGPFPYVVRSNNVGLRGDDVSIPKKAGTKRIVTIGDSVTDGYFVDNENTWQYFLNQILNNKSDNNYEVVNCARGGGSIDVALYQFREYAIPLDPDIVLLTFVSNDIADILDRRASELINYKRNQDSSLRTDILKFFLTQTAIGELCYDSYLKLISRSYRARNEIIKKSQEERYNLPGSLDFNNNARLFLKRFGMTDGLVLGNEFDNRTLNAMQIYFDLLGRIADECKSKNIKLIFIYFPAYSQIYLPDSPTLINEILKEECIRLNVEFIDLTEGFRAAAKKGKALHLTPIDYHLNPVGNEIFAQLLATHLIEIEQKLRK